MSENGMLVERRACCQVASAFLGRLQPLNLTHIPAENVQNMSFQQTPPGVNGLNPFQNGHSLQAKCTSLQQNSSSRQCY